MSRTVLILVAAMSIALAASCSKGERTPSSPSGPPSGGGGPEPDPYEELGAKSGGYSDDKVDTTLAGFTAFRDKVQPLLAEQCADCHQGQRFAFAAFQKAGLEFTEEETVANYRTFVDLLSLDNPPLSRLLAKILPESDEGALTHRGGAIEGGTSAPLYQAVLDWANTEKSEQCPGCGVTAPFAYIGYVEQPELFWMLMKDPIRLDRGARTGARIMLQPVKPDTAEPVGEPIDFLAGTDFCSDGSCDFGRMASSHAGGALLFECRKSVSGEEGLDISWNICVAGISATGKAVEPRFLLPEQLLHQGRQSTRADPFGTESGLLAKGVYDKHYQTRRSFDSTPIFSADDRRVIFAAQREDPDSGVTSVQTYHGYFVVDNLISADLNGESRKTIYRNEGGTADLPFFLRNGNIAFHTWNLDRMDRHMYVQALADGMMEIPVLGGNLQGPNMWGKAFQSNNGVIVGLTGRRRGELENFAPFVFDHTLGISTTNSGFTEKSGFELLPAGYMEEIGDYPDGYCDHGLTTAEAAAGAPNCTISKLILDPAYMPAGKALVAYNPEKTYIGIGEDFVINYADGSTTQELQESAKPYFPKKLGIGLFDLAGNVTTLLPNQPGKMYRYPVWVGAVQHPRLQKEVVKDSKASTLHIADFPLWLSFQAVGNGLGRKSLLIDTLDTIVAVRVLRKIGDGNACLFDERYIRMSNAETNGFHPTALGYIDATGYERFQVPAALGGNAFGDIPLKEDRSVSIQVPSGELLLFQGVDEFGSVVSQHERVFALPAGHKVEASVKRGEYYSQCASCHGVISNDQAVEESYYTENLAAVMSFDTLAASAAPVDLTDSRATTVELSYLKSLRGVLDEKCTSCHAGESPEGGLSLDDTYSTTGNYPPEAWEPNPITRPAYATFMADKNIVRSPNFSVSYSWFFADDHQEYKDEYATEMASDAPLGARAPWDPGYQNLFRQDASNSFYYLNGSSIRTAFGRGYDVPSNSARSFLIEILTGRDHDADKAYAGAFDHTSLLNDFELRTLLAVLDVGFPYMGRCGDRTIPQDNLPNAGESWGETFE